MRRRAVIFDLGGVVLPSPLAAFREHERRTGLPHRFISDVIVRSGEHGAWSRLERGELAPEEFAVAFAAECDAAGARVDVAELFASMRSSGSGEPVPVMVEAITTIREHGLRTAALTNNWIDANAESHVTGDSPLASQLATLFDVIVESARVGLRKPDPRIYALVCEALDVHPGEAVFLDDLGANLKPARAMGMETIKVEDPTAAVQALGAALELDLVRA